MKMRDPRLALALVVVLAACGDGASPVEDEAPTPAEVQEPPLRAETRTGPVTATVSLAPAAPRLGDALTLTLAVVAEADVAVDMPAFGDALGRFAIVDFTPREEVDEDGAVRFLQRYTLQAPTSGRQRIPQLRIEFVDERAGQTDARPLELLTDELGFEVESVLPEGEVIDELLPARAPLAELEGPWLTRNWLWLAAAVAALAVVAGGVVVWLRRAAERRRLTAFDRATARLDRLRRQGLPDAARMDSWYVELSDIVRRYIEERFALRAPELTTEEFLLEAGRSTELTAGHRELLSAFLARCDRVKFARYSPGEGESQEALEVAHRFLRETRATTQDRAAAGDAMDLGTSIRRAA